MNKEDNLTFKKITEFTEEDTIYIRVDSHNGPAESYLCNFKSFKSGAVTAETIKATVNPRTSAVGKEITAKLSNCFLVGQISGEKRSRAHWIRPDLTFAKESNKVHDNDMHVSEHESYGMVTVHRGYGNKSRALFGSSIKHANTIRLAIDTAKHDRDLNNDYFHSKRNIIQIELSEAQFAQMITNFNNEGTPCTIRRVMGSNMEEPLFISKVEQFNNEFSNKMHNLSEDMKGLVEDSLGILNDKKSINKGDREFIASAINRLIMNVEKNIPFVNEQFAEQIDGVVHEAKSAIESFLEQKIKEKGLEQIKGMSAEKLLGTDKEY